MSTNPFPQTAPAEVYVERRRALASTLSGPLVVAGGMARPRQIATNLWPFRASSHYLYFGGPPVEGAALVIEPGSNGEAGVTLLRPVAGYEDAVWVGEIPGDDCLSAHSGIDAARFAAPEQLGRLFGAANPVYLAPPCLPTLSWLDDAGVKAAGDDVQRAVAAMRLIKDEHEIQAMKRAAAVTASAFERAMRMTRPGLRESDIAAAFHAALMAENCSTSFTPIITVNGHVLHLEGYPNLLEAGRLLLVDGGAEEPGGYACDVTRTFPVAGSFTGIQKELYEVVRRAEQEAVAACLPGKRYRDVHDLAAEWICKGLVEVGLMKGDPLELAGRRAHVLFFPHGVGHLLGMDAHDTEDFGDLAGYADGRTRRSGFGDKYLRLDRDLQPGMVVTIEPGFYVIPAVWGQEALYKPFADAIDLARVHELLEGSFGGIRLEDDVLVRESGLGPENLTADIPIRADVLESIVGAA